MKTLISKQEQVSIAIDKLKASPLNSYEMTDIDDLKMDIMTYGLLVPLTVCGPNEDGMYEILSGHRRYEAIRRAREEGNLSDYDKITCMIVGNDDLSDIKKKLIIEVTNLTARRDFNEEAHRFTVIDCLKKLVEEGEEDERNIVKRAANYFGTSERYAGMYKSIMEKGTKELQEVAKDGTIASISDLQRLSAMDEETQNEAIKQIKGAKNKKEAKQIVKDYAEKEKQIKNMENPNKMEDEFFADDYDDIFDASMDAMAGEKTEMLSDFNYEIFYDQADILLGMEKLEPDTEAYDAVKLCAQIAEKFHMLG